MGYASLFSPSRSRLFRIRTCKMICIIGIVELLWTRKWPDGDPVTPGAVLHRTRIQLIQRLAYSAYCAFGGVDRSTFGDLMK